MDNTTSILGIAVRDLSRLRQVSTVVVRHGFGEVIARSPLSKLLFKDKQLPEESEELKRKPAAVRFKRLLESLGPTYIKLGQVLSTRTDLLPTDYIEELKHLQDNAPELLFEDVRIAVESTLGASLDELFQNFNPEPLATASIAQTHLATTHTGEKVVVKVQRPRIEKVMRGDLDLLYLGAKILEATIDEVDIYSPSDIVVEFERALIRELNFTYELSNLQTARQLLQDNAQVIAPQPYPELSGRRVLTMEFFNGAPLRKLKPNSPEAKHAVEAILHAGCKQVFIDGFFHGDPHPGNILVNEEGIVCFIDWGLTGRLSPSQREDIVTLILAAIANDADTIARILLKMGNATQRINMADFKSEITRIRRQQLEVSSFDEYDSSQFLQEFVKAAQKYQIKLATEYSVLTKVTSTVEGLIRSLHPECDVVSIARPYAEHVVKDRFTPEKILGEALHGVTGMGAMIRQLPNQLDQVLHDVETGNLQVRALTPNLDSLVPQVHHVGSRICMAFFGASMTLSAALLLPNDPTTIYKVPILSVLCILLSVVAWVVLWWWHFIGLGKAKISPLVRFFNRS